MTRADTDRAAALAASKASQANAKRENAAHTPGPWMVEPLGSDCFEVKCECGYFIATCHDGVRGDRNADVNARLIAAAPDLLAALQEMYEAASDSDSCHYGTLSTTFLRKIAHAAIVKATGEEP